MEQRTSSDKYIERAIILYTKTVFFGKYQPFFGNILLLAIRANLVNARRARSDGSLIVQNCRGENS